MPVRGNPSGILGAAATRRARRHTTPLRLEQLTWGTGNRIAVLIHGLSARAALWDDMGRKLAAAGYRAIAPDLRGHGHSPRGPYSVDHWIADLLENMAVGPDLAIGHSLGGILLLEAVDRLRPKRAVYIDPPWLTPADPEKTIRDFEARKLLSRDAIASANLRWTPEEIDLRHEGFRLWDSTTARAFIQTRAADYTPAAQPAQPSLAVLPDSSELAPPDAVERLRALGWDAAVFAGTGHYVHLDDRGAVTSRLGRWLELVEAVDEL